MGMAKITKWVVFGVLFGLAPLLADYLVQSLHPRPAPPFDWSEILMKGELLIVSAAITGAAVGELIGSSKSWLWVKILAGGGCIIVMIAAALLYASIASDLRSQVRYDTALLV